MAGLSSLITCLRWVGLAVAVGAAPSAFANPPPAKKPDAAFAEGAAAEGRRPGLPATQVYTQQATALLAQAGVSAAQARSWAQASGLVSRAELPPGIRRQLVRGKPLPPGIARQTLPVAYLEQLPQHPGYVWMQAGSDLILVATAGAVIADVLADVFR